MILYILVEVFQLIVSGIYISSNLEKVKQRFKEYTGVDYDEFKAKWDADKDLTSDMLLGDFDQTKIFKVEAKVSQTLGEYLLEMSDTLA